MSSTLSWEGQGGSMDDTIGRSDESFLPQIIGIFYAVFDPHRGPIVTNQVPENLITTGAALSNNTVLSPHASDPSLDPTLTSSISSLTTSGSVPPPLAIRGRQKQAPTYAAQAVLPASTSSSAHRQSPDRSPTRSSSRHSLRTLSLSPARTHRSVSVRSASPAFNPYAPPGRPASVHNAFQSTLLDFALLSDYIIPRSALKHRLITCVSGKFKVLGFPCVIDDERYERNELKWNLAFVFDRRADLSAFDPVVRKCGRLLRTCELDNRYLSAPQSSSRVQSIIEQLFEDLNSYSETSILVDGVNGIEIKLFPFHPNPPLVEDWHVPVPLVDLGKLRESNWDIMAAKVAGFIDGVNHAGRIAQLADADPRITRLCLQHFLFYQVIAMIDIFQFSNMYTVKPSIQRVTREDSVATECGVYVTREYHPIPSWPVLLQLYAKLRPGVSLSTWMEQNRTEARGIDVRRFVTFGVIKGFLRRVHRWPIFVDHGAGSSDIIARTGNSSVASSAVGNGRQGSLTGLAMRQMSTMVGAGAAQAASTSPNMESAITLRSSRSNNSLGGSPVTRMDHMALAGSSRARGYERGTMAADKPFASSSYQSSTTGFRDLAGNLATSQNTNTSAQQQQPGPFSASSRTGSSALVHARNRMTSNVVDPQDHAPGVSHPSNYSTKGMPSGTFGQTQDALRRPRRTSFRSSRNPAQESAHLQSPTLDEIKRYLDGNHHADEIQTRMQMSWKTLDGCLRKIGGGIPARNGEGVHDGQEGGGFEQGNDGQYGDVVVVFR